MKRYHILYLLISLIFVSCSENKDAKELFAKVESVMEEHPDSALAMLDSAYAKKDDWKTSQQMRYELLRAKAQNKAYVDFTTDSIMLKVAEYYDSHGTSNEQMEAHYLLGCTYRDMGEAPMALSCYLDATEKADTLSDNCDYRTLMRIWGQVADEYNRQAMPYKELEANKRFEELALYVKDSTSFAIGIEKESNAYTILEDTANIISSINRASTIYNNLGKHIHSKIALARLISIYLDKNELSKVDSIIMDFEKEPSFFKSNGDIVEGRECYYFYKGLYYEKTNTLDSAEYYFKRLDTNEYEACRKLLDLYIKLNNADSICKYSRLKEQVFVKNFTNYHTQAMFNAEGMFNYARNQKLALKNEMEANRNLKIIFVVVICSLFLFILLFNRHKQSIREKEKEKDMIKMEYHIMQERYSHIKNDLKLMKLDYSEYVRSKEKELEDIKSYISDKNFITIGITEQENVNKIMQCAEMSIFLDVLKPGNSHYPTDKDWGALISIFSNELPMFYATITKDNILSKSELQATILTRLGLSTTELSFIMNKPVQRISNLKSLANKKLFGMSGAKQFYENLLTIFDSM